MCLKWPNEMNFEKKSRWRAVHLLKQNLYLNFQQKIDILNSINALIMLIFFKASKMYAYKQYFIFWDFMVIFFQIPGFFALAPLLSLIPTGTSPTSCER